MAKETKELMWVTYHCSACNFNTVVPQFNLDVEGMGESDRDRRRKLNEAFIERNWQHQGVKCDQCKSKAELKNQPMEYDAIDWEALNNDESFALFNIYSLKKKPFMKKGEISYEDEMTFDDIYCVEELFEAGEDLISRTWQAVKQAVDNNRAPGATPENMASEITIPLFCYYIKHAADFYKISISYSAINNGRWFEIFQKRIFRNEKRGEFEATFLGGQFLNAMESVPLDLVKKSKKNLADIIKAKVMKGFAWVNAFIHGNEQEVKFYPLIKKRVAQIDSRLDAICRVATGDGIDGGKITEPVDQKLCHKAVTQRMDVQSVFSCRLQILKGFKKACYFVYVPQEIFDVVDSPKKELPEMAHQSQVITINRKDMLFYALSCHQGPRDILRYGLIILYQILLHELEQEEETYGYILKPDNMAQQVC